VPGAAGRPEHARVLWAARLVGADLQKVRCASRPLRSVSRELAHKGGQRLGVNDVLDRLAPMVGIGGLKAAGGAKGRSTG
jgi:hypothetical protein